MKPCIFCKNVKPLSEFYVHPQMRDGHLNKCKVCCRRYEGKRRVFDDSVREKDRARAKRPDVATRIRAIAKRWRVENPDRYRAHNAVNNAVRDGKLQKQPCRVCGAERVHAHHPDYSKPLEVVWLCPAHHAREIARPVFSEPVQP